MFKRNFKNSKYDNLAQSLKDNIYLFKNIFKHDETLIVREFQNKKLKQAQRCIIYLDGMVNAEIIDDIINNDLLEEDANLLKHNKLIISKNVTIETEIIKIISSVIYGDMLFLIDGYDKALIVNGKVQHMILA